jgi:hypothetical protein
MLDFIFEYKIGIEAIASTAKTISFFFFKIIAKCPST